jgi:hypothetical protein
MKRVLLILVVPALLAVFPALSRAGTIAGKDAVLGVEDVNNGFVGDLGLNHSIVVASDGEVAFDPFGFGGDTSDDIKFGTELGAVSLNPNWVQFTASDGNPSTWALPAMMENEPPSESVGSWIFPGFIVIGGPLTFTILDSPSDPFHQGVSDYIVVQNNAQGVASLTFGSEVTPEPASLTLLGLGIVGLGGYAWRRRKTAKA